MALDSNAARTALQNAIGIRLGLDADTAAVGVIEMVDETMANAARIHAIESGKTFAGRTLIAFGGGGPVHATRIAEKIGITRILVPPGAGVGSAIGFLRAPIGYEVVRSLYQRLNSFDSDAVNALLDDMTAEARSVVDRGRFGAAITSHRIAFMRYVGQGHEIPVDLPGDALPADAGARLRAAFDVEYGRFYDRPVPGSDVEVMSYAVSVATIAEARPEPAPTLRPASAARSQMVRDPATGQTAPWTILERAAMPPGTAFSGPAIVVEDETSTLVGLAWNGKIDSAGIIVLTRSETV
jgi:N-methylhydantoinase A